MTKSCVSRVSKGLLVFVCCLLQSCGVIVPGTPWATTSEEGPLLMGNRHAEVVKRCSLFPPIMGRGSCEEAFVDHYESKVRWLYIRDQIDNYLPKVSPLAPWVGEPNGLGITKPHRSAPPYVIPYRMHILTISPIIVLAVPKVEDKRINYCSVPGRQGCISSPRTGAAFFYKGNINIVPGSFWFSPDLPVGVSYVPDAAQNYNIELPDSRLELVAEKGEWKVTRVPPGETLAPIIEAPFGHAR